MTKAIDIIHDEHRALAAMLQGLKTLVGEIGAGRQAPDFDLLAAMIEYIHAVPERVHHPKESEFLFARLRARHPAAIPALDELEDDHRREAERSQVLESALAGYRQRGGEAFPPFQAAVLKFIDEEWRHMTLEEKEIFPLARQCLTEEDWTAIDAAFSANDNPWQGPAGQYARLFTQIVNRAPPPVGVGPE